jgi:transglutaminase-like putative cysteine protease
MTPRRNYTAVRTTVTVVLAAGLIAETVVIGGLLVKAPTYRQRDELFRTTETVEQVVDYDFESANRFVNDVEVVSRNLFTINSAEDLRTAIAQQRRELNTTFFLNIRSDLNVRDIMQKTEAGLTRLRFSFDFAIDSNGNRVASNYHLYQFTVEYRDDVKVLEAFRDARLLSKLTASELKLMDRAKQIISDIVTPDMTDYDITLAIHDYIITNGRYDSRPADPAIRADVHKTEGILINGVGVCSSYAGAMYLLLNMTGIETIFVTGIARNASGRTELHAWNKVQLGDQWYNIDATWNTPTSTRLGIDVSYTFFAVTDAILSTTHTWDTKMFPQVAASKEHNFFHRNGLVSRNYSEFRSIITRGIRENADEKDFSLRFFVENYDPNTHLLNFIFDILPNDANAICSRIPGTSGEFVLRVTRGEVSA